MDSGSEYIKRLLAQAERARRHAKWLNDDMARRALLAYAADLEAEAKSLRGERTVATLPEQAADAATGEPEIGPDLVAAMKPPVSPGGTT